MGRDKYREKVYNLWYNMNRRCYDKKSQRFNSYKDVSVCDRWLTFSNFIEDVEHIDGFNYHAFMSGELTLDKDYKSVNVKMYSMDTCLFISKEYNNKIKPNQQYRFIAISPSGKEYEGVNQSDFARKFNLKQNGINSCLNGSRKSHMGWKFYKKQNI